MAEGKLHEANLLGIDVGYSDKRATTGIARCGPSGFASYKTTRHLEDRRRALGAGITFDWVAIDGPLLPEPADELMRREVERAFISGPFAKRCKPGLSDCGQGLSFRSAARITLEHIVENVALKPSPMLGSAVMTGKPVVEAFPNGFIGVLLPESVFQASPKLKRGRKFDWLYDHFVGMGLHQKLMDYLAWKDDRLAAEISREKDHEKRAALICLLTAGCAASGCGCPVGESKGGWFWLPPLELWTQWARTASIDSLLGTRI